MSHEIRYISEPQKKFIRDLIEQKVTTELPQAQQDFLSDLSDENLNQLTSRQASNAITALLACSNKPKEVKVVQASENQDQSGASASGEVTTEMRVREGHFFIIDPTNDEERFFRVRHGKEGTRWEGYAFLDVQASDYFYPIKDRKHREVVFAEIAKDPVKAMNEYGLRIGRCGVCNRTLTDRHSILRGIGPICAAKLEPTGEQMAMIDLIRQKSNKPAEPAQPAQPASEESDANGDNEA